jgi:pyruvate dehydrogenase E2 component (dihydrolipoamide acetyltransferase)
VRAVLESRKDAAPGASAVAQSRLPDFSKWGAVTVEPMSKVRRKTAEQMARAWNRIPHVTHYDAADITEMDQLRIRHSQRGEAAGGKLSMTAVLLKILASALVEFPKFNTSIDVDTASIIYKKYVHLGVAMDTEKGLLVPVIRDAGEKTIPEIAMELHALSEKARNRNIRPDELQGATFTLTNLGGIGGRAFSPLINPPEVAILGVSRARIEAEYVEERFEPRLMMPLSVSYDHRVIDGADAARFMRWICQALQQPLAVNWEGA